MGTYYGLGVVTEFESCSESNLNIDTWRKTLDNRFDIGIFDITIDKSTVTGHLKQDVFKENIEDFINLLSAITGSDSIDYSFRKHGTNIEEYQKFHTEIRVNDDCGKEVTVYITMALLFTEGKVLAETFNKEPKLINWLFMHSNIENKLRGAVISDIVG